MYEERNYHRDNKQLLISPKNQFISYDVSRVASTGSMRDGHGKLLINSHQYMNRNTRT